MTFLMLHEAGTRAVDRVRRPRAVMVNVTVPTHGRVRRSVEIATRARPATRRELTLRASARRVRRASLRGR
ncbi:MAG: hypothetical protein H0W96_14980 [Solirubrobacterales bacterium]|nr:hypothetical protein [Solirubrobacterales bacterium]